MGKTAIILGATGLTGSLLLNKLLIDDRYSHIKLFSRASCGIKDPKIEEHLINLFELPKHDDLFKADEVFCCIGTTKAKTPDKAQYLKIDYVIPVDAAKLCIENHINTFIVISALGADSKSKVFYNKTKGKMESTVLEQQIKHTYILQPSLIAGDREEKRFGEFLAKQFMRLIKPFLFGGLLKYKAIHPETIAECMIWLANNPFEAHRIESDVIQKIADKA